MKKPKNVVLLFHIYQPPWQEIDLIKNYYEDRYLNLLKYFLNNPKAKLTLNITGSLLEQFNLLQFGEFFNIARELIDKGQLELTGSAMYHPILPLIPEKETIRQINLNEELGIKLFGEHWNKNQASGRGFYLPEVAYSPGVAKVIKDKGFSWIPVGRGAIDYYASIDWNKKYTDINSNLNVLIRNELVHNDATMMPEFQKNDQLIFIEDGEDKLMPNRTDLRWQTILDPEYELNFKTVGEYLNGLEVEEKVELHDSNWEMTEDEFKKKSYFHIWNDKENDLHKNLWDFAYELIDLVNANTKDQNYEYARKDLDRALSSCTWWWVDGRFNGYYPTAIQKGLDIMINVVRTFNDLDIEKRLHYEKRYSEILFLIWKRFWVQKKN